MAGLSPTIPGKGASNGSGGGPFNGMTCRAISRVPPVFDIIAKPKNIHHKGPENTKKKDLETSTLATLCSLCLCGEFRICINYPDDAKDEGSFLPRAAKRAASRSADKRGSSIKRPPISLST